MIKSLKTLPRLLIPQDVQEDDGGATLHFHQGIHGRLARGDADYETFLRLAQRCQERQHPVGVRFGEGQTIVELIRADNDIPTEVCGDAAGVRVLFQGHDGVFRLKDDHPELTRLRVGLSHAIQCKARIWFIVQKSDQSLLDILPIGWITSASHRGDGNEPLASVKDL
jgi:hypothetical protein